jgi:hypothetical protein
LELSMALLPLHVWGDTHLRRISRATKRHAH